ncbi:MAG: hypothetical protein ISS23_01685 [Nanoarchaeota archaeon]|nr:hypothetical protein [Nanoarchaeota archaeon]
MKNFDKIIDETGLDMRLKGTYHGSHEVHLEAKIMKYKREFYVCIFLDNEEIDSSRYDPSKHTLDIWYKKSHMQPGEVRLGILPTFKVDKDIKEINMYDFDS